MKHHLFTLLVTGGHREIVKALLEKNADINKCDRNGCSPLNASSEAGHQKLLKNYFPQLQITKTYSNVTVVVALHFLLRQTKANLR